MPSQKSKKGPKIAETQEEFACRRMREMQEIQVKKYNTLINEGSELDMKKILEAGNMLSALKRTENTHCQLVNLKRGLK